MAGEAGTVCIAKRRKPLHREDSEIPCFQVNHLLSHFFWATSVYLEHEKLASFVSHGCLKSLETLPIENKVLSN